MTIQTKEDLEKWYEKEDPWKYRSTEDDIIRRDYILGSLNPYGIFESALDIGAGEGFITERLPAYDLYAIECSDNASSRLRSWINRISEKEATDTKHDLVIATGILYEQYDTNQILNLIQKCSEKIILTCNISSWEQQHIIDQIPGKIVYFATFPYREYTQHLRIFKK